MIPPRARFALAVAGLCVLSACVGAATAALGGEGAALPVVSHAAPWSWYLTGADQSTYMGRLRGGSDLALGTNSLTGGSTWSADLIALEGADGNFEFEHFWPSHKSIFAGGSASTADPGGIAIGSADGQDVVPLIVAGDSAERRLQLWKSGGHVVASVGSDGGLTLGGIELVAGVDAYGRVEIDAVLADGTHQALLVGKPF